MKTVFILSVTLAAVTAGIFAQTNVEITPVKSDALYIANDNPVKITVRGVPADKVSATISHGTISKLSGTDYVATPATDVSAVTVEVFAEKNGKTVKIGSKEFPVKLTSVPRATIAGKSYGKITKAEIIAQDGLEIDLGDNPFVEKVEITQFSVDNTIFMLKSNSAKFTDSQKRIINSMEKGQRIIFSDIKIRYPERPDREYHLMDIYFRID